MKNIFYQSLLCASMALTVQTAGATDILSHISLKQPGNPAVCYNLKGGTGRLSADKPLPVEVSVSVKNEGADEVVTVSFTATATAYFNYGASVNTGFKTDDCEFYMPGFWYHKNLRSPKEAPSFHTSKSWNFREDRLSAPLTGAFDEKTGEGMTVLRQTDDNADALTTHTEGEVILSGKSSVGYVGFDNETGVAALNFGYPYIETPKRYIRKLTLAPAIEAFAKIEKGETKSISWRIRKVKAANYGDFVAGTWNYCFDTMNPQPLKALYTPEEMKAQMTNFFRESYVDNTPLKMYSGLTIRCDDCKPSLECQIGFCGRVLLNAFNSIEYGDEHKLKDLSEHGRAIFDSFLANGFTKAGYLHDFWNMKDPEPSAIHTIRQQSEAVYAVLLYLDYERKQGRRHKEWENRMRTLLNNFVALQKTDGSIARKFNDDNSDVDASCGSTPSATVPLVMGYKYFGDKKYLKAAARTVDYVEKHIIAPSDYFSSTLDANCEDKEAAISAATATYYMALVSKGKARTHYVDLCKKSAYFALSWYYLWDVPFAQGQMLGDLGFKSRGWGNVSVENNHIDVFVFELPSILKWLSAQTGEKRFEKMYNVIYSSLNQLLPTPQRLCGIGKPGYYPEVVQHTTWDYGRNGKGFYNDIFAPGWTVASLWELYTPQRTPSFFK